MWGRLCAGGSVPLSGQTAGKSPKPLESPRPRGSNISWDVPGGTLQTSAKPSARIWWSIWASLSRSWSLMRPGVSRKASMRPGSPGTRAGPPRGQPGARSTAHTPTLRGGYADTIECPRDAASLLAARAGDAAACGADTPVVRVAPLAPRNRPVLALETTGNSTTTTVVLVRRTVWTANELYGSPDSPDSRPSLVRGCSPFSRSPFALLLSNSGRPVAPPRPFWDRYIFCRRASRYS